MKMPGPAPLTPDCQVPAVVVTLPAALYSAVFSPKYQTLPCLSCAYQSSVFSIGLPCTVVTSRTTVQVTPSITLVWPVATNLSTVGSPSLTPLETQV